MTSKDLDADPDYIEGQDYDEEDEAGPPARMPRNVLGPLMVVTAIVVAAGILGSYFAATGNLDGLYLVGLAWILVTVVYGMWRRYEYGRAGAIMVGTLILLVALGSALGPGLIVLVRPGAGPIILGLVLGPVMIWCLTRPDSKAWFRVPF